MRNLIVSNEIFTLVADSAINIVSLTLDLETLFLLGDSGHVYCFSSYDSFQTEIMQISLQGPGGNDSTWFLIQFLGDLNELVCTSYSGYIETLKSEDFHSKDSFHYDGLSDQVGVVDGGIASASWSPDQTCFAIVTNNNSLMCMPRSWDDVLEIAIEARMPNTVTSISWCGDSESFVILSVDASDGVARLRVFSRTLEYLVMGRTVNQPGLLRAVGPVATFSPNGCLIVTPQRKSADKLLIAILEKNGLQHGEFEVQIPAGMDERPGSGCIKCEWQVRGLHWDMQSTILAVSIATNPMEGVSTRHAVQLYCRSNYHWYLKQQWVEEGVRCLGFDQEMTGRLYIAHGGRVTAVRSVDLTWDVCRSSGSECTVVVTDGKSLLLTPLGRCLVPPPMSMHQLSVSCPPRCIACFQIPLWSISSPISTPSDMASDVSSGGPLCFGLLAVCGSVLRVFLGDPSGSICLSDNVDLTDIPEYSGFIVRSVCASVGVCGDRDVGAICVLLAGSRVDASLFSTSSPSPQLSELSMTHSDDLLLLELRLNAPGTHLVLTSHQWKKILGRVVCLTSVPVLSDDTVEFAIGTVLHETFDVLAVRAIVPDVLIYKLTAMPELCTHIEAVRRGTSTGTGGGTGSSIAVLGLCPKGRLYCDNSLLLSGVNSFTCNASTSTGAGASMSMDALLCVTAGTRPLLRFLSLSAAIAEDAEGMGADAGRAEELGEPRPVERGARLVAAVAGDAKVIIQLPRGNLEAFEPRPLLLRRARQLLNAGLYLDCLVLLRRQRVDLNLIVDHDPMAFVSRVEDFVHIVLERDADLLSLLISALSSEDVTVTKYPETTPGRRLPAATAVDTAARTVDWSALCGSGGSGGDKVNCVCAVLRTALLDRLHAGAEKALQPLLCTFAKSVPAQLVEALALIKQVATGSASSGSAPSDTSDSAVLTSAKAQSAIKYLSFLADTSQLFEAAVGDCDFNLARVVARLGQLDPKQYLPLLAGFEAVGAGASTIIAQREGSICVSQEDASLLETFFRQLMRHKVLAHLKRFQDALRCGVAATETASRLQDGTLLIAMRTHTTELSNGLVHMANKNDLLQAAVALCQATGADLSNSSSSSCGIALVKQLSSRMLWSYASNCAAKGSFRESVTSYLMTSPPSVREAVAAARQLGDWHWAIAIAARFETAYVQASQDGDGLSISNSGQETLIARNGQNDDLTARSVAEEIVETYITALEQGQGAVDTYSAVGVGEGGDGGIGDGDRDRSEDIARFCLDYLQDSVQAVTVLRLARCWREAMRLSCAYGRRDLLQEVLSECVSSAKEALTALSAMKQEFLSVSSDLTVLWADPTARLAQVASTEAALGKLLAAQAKADVQSDDGVGDGQSEYSAMTGGSAFSRQSEASIRSGASAVSTSSRMSAASGVSLSGVSTSKFSVSGLDHALLSRGAVRDDRLGGDAKRRRRKARNQGDSRDVWGLKREGRLAGRLWLLGDLCPVVRVVSGLCAALLLAGGDPNIVLAGRLQAAVDDLASAIRSHPAPHAPEYPREWLLSRDMNDVAHFQSDTTVSAVGDDKNESPLHSWWDRASLGLASWEEARSNCLLSSCGPTL